MEISGRHRILGNHDRCQLGVPHASDLTAYIPATWNTCVAWCEVAEPVCVTARTCPPGSSCPDLSTCSTVGGTRVLCPPPPPALEIWNELECEGTMCPSAVSLGLGPACQLSRPRHPGPPSAPGAALALCPWLSRHGHLHSWRGRPSSWSGLWRFTRRKERSAGRCTRTRTHCASRSAHTLNVRGLRYLEGNTGARAARLFRFSY